MADEAKAEKLICRQCSSDGKIVDAEGFCKTCNIHLCEACFKTHLNPFPMRSHVLVSKDNMPKNQTQLEDMCSIVCRHHKELLKFYCKFHQVAICSDGLIKDHEKCDEKLKVSDVATKEKEYQGNKKKLADLCGELGGLQTKAEQHQMEVRKNSRAAKNDAEEFHKQLNAFTDKLIQSMTTDIDAIAKEDTTKMERIQDNCKQRIKRINEMAAEQNKLHEENRNCDLFVTMKRSVSEVREIQEDTLIDKSQNSIRMYHFVKNAELNEVMRDVVQWGSLVDKDGKEVRHGVPFKPPSKQPKKQRVIQVKRGKIEDQGTDVIVNSVSPTLTLKQSEGCVSTAIEKKAGSIAEMSLKQAAKDQSPKSGDVFDGEPGGLKCKRLFHVVLTEYKSKSSSVELLTDAIAKCLERACDGGFKSISFPAIGTGVLKFSTEVVAKTFAKTVVGFYAKKKNASVEEIAIVILDDDTADDKLVTFDREFTREGHTSRVKKVFVLPY